jgi:hypothetical protein
MDKRSQTERKKSFGKSVDRSFRRADSFSEKDNQPLEKVGTVEDNKSDINQ